MRLTFCWRRAARLPTVMERTATIQSSGAQREWSVGKHFIDHAQKQGEGRGFGRGGEQRDDGRGRAFVDVGRPDVEGRGGDFEENADEHERQRGENEGLILRGGRECGDLVDLRGSGGAEDERDAVEQECGGEGAEQEVFDGGFRAAAGVLAVAGEDVGGDGRDFESDEDDEQLDGAGEQAHADCAEDNERVELALMVAVFGERVEREQEGHENDAADEDVEEDGEGAGFDGGEEAGSFRQGKLPEAGPEGDAWFRWRRPSRAGGAARRAAARRR